MSTRGLSCPDDTGHPDVTECLDYFASKLASAVRPRKESLVTFSCSHEIINQKKQTPLPINDYQLAKYFALKASLQHIFSDTAL